MYITIQERRSNSRFKNELIFVPFLFHFVFGFDVISQEVTVKQDESSTDLTFVIDNVNDDKGAMDFFVFGDL